MKVVSEDFKARAENQYGVKYYPKIVVDTIELPEDIENFKCDFMANPDGTFSFGNTCAASVSFSIVEPSMNLAGKELEVYQGLKIGDEIRYILLGKFTVLKPKNNKGEHFYECYDRMVSRMEMPYFSELSGTVTDVQVLNEICEQTNIELANADSLISHTLSSIPIGYTRREVIGYMAQLQGKNAIINADGNLELIWYKETDYVVDDDKIYLDGTDAINDETDYTLGYLKCSVTNTDRTEPIELTSGSGTVGISFANPFMTQEILDEVFEVIGGFSFRPLEVEFLGDFRLEVGDIVTVDTNGGTYTVPIMQLEHDCDGGVVTVIKSVAETDEENQIDERGPLTKQMDRYYAELLFVKDIAAHSMTVDQADIRYARMDQLDVIEANITSAVIDTIDGRYASIDYIDANYANIDFSNVEKSTVGTLLADVGLITSANIVNGHVSGYLDAVEVNANSITAGTLSVDRLVFRGSTESIVYELNNITGALQAIRTDTLNGEILTDRSITVDKIVAKSITANEIAVVTITSNELAANCITAEKIVANAITGDKIAVNTIESANIKSDTITSDKIASKAITAEKIDVENLFAQDITATGTITGLNLASTHISAASFQFVDGSNNLLREVQFLPEDIQLCITDNNYDTPGTYTSLIELMPAGGLIISGRNMTFYDWGTMAFTGNASFSDTLYANKIDMTGALTFADSTYYVDSNGNGSFKTVKTGGTIESGGTVRIPNGYAYQAYDANGDNRVCIGLNADNQYEIAVGGMDNTIRMGSSKTTALTINSTNTTINGNIRTTGWIALPNAKGYYCKNSSGSDIQAVYMNASNELLLGGGISSLLKIGNASNTTRTQIFSKGRIDLLAFGVTGTNGNAITIERASTLSSDTVAYNAPTIRPTANLNGYLGTSSYRWTTLFVGSSGVNSSSDRRLKNNIKDLDERYLSMWDNLVPKSYWLNADKTNTT